MEISYINNLLPVNNQYCNNKKQQISSGLSCDSFETEFSKNKKKMAENLRKYDINKNLIKNFEKARDEMEYNLALEDITYSVLEKYENSQIAEKSLWQNAAKRHTTNLALEQYFYKLKAKTDKKLLSFFKDISQKDTKPDIIKIKNELKYKYNIKETYFDNNKECAQMCLDAVKILKEKDFPLPDCIIYNKYFPYGGISFAVDNKKIIIINPENADEWMQSTGHRLHTITHECVHCTQPGLIAFSVKKIPAEFQNTVSNLSLYADENFTHEIHAELVTKKLLDELTADEQKLLDYIEK